MKTATAFMFALAVASCATAAPPSELVSARASYQSAKQGAAASFNPADLHTATKALDAAERAFARDGDTSQARDLAYVADRRARIAQARGNATRLTQSQQRTIEEMHSRTSTQLDSANQRLAAQNQALATERAAHAAAEKRAAQATADLAKVASVKEESRGLVITLSGGVLFASSKSDLLPTAQLKLNSVAQALTQQDPDANMVVEGHTDSQGGASYNQALSERRADTVREYLVSRGVAADRVSSQGFGSSRSVADNGSAEGRANNRRVEIVVEPKGSAAARPVIDVKPARPTSK